MTKMTCLKVQVNAIGDCTMLTVFFPVREHCGKAFMKREIEQAQFVAEALAFEQLRRASVLGLSLHEASDFRIPEVHKEHTAESSYSAFFDFYRYSARKNARALRTRLLEEMILFVTMSRDLLAWAESTRSTEMTLSS